MASPLDNRPLTAAEARSLWLEHLANERRASPRTLEAYGFAAARYIAFLEQHRGESLTVQGLAGEQQGPAGGGLVYGQHVGGAEVDAGEG